MLTLATEQALPALGSCGQWRIPLATLIRPRLLHPLNRLWTRLAVLISKVTNPVMTGLMFYVLFTPVAIVLRLMGKDLLRLKAQPGAKIFWIPRDPPGPAPETMRNQF